MTEIKNLIEVYHEKVAEVFGKIAEQKAREIGFEKRERKINATVFIITQIYLIILLMKNLNIALLIPAFLLIKIIESLIYFTYTKSYKIS